MSARSPAASPVEEWPTPGSKSSGATSVEWAAGGAGLETSSASSYRNVPEPSATEYDDWLSNLNLPTATPGQPAMPTTAAFTSPFDDDIDSADFGDGPFSAPSVDDLLNELPPVATAPASRPPEPSIRDAFRSSSRAEAAPAKPPAREKEKEKPKPPKASPKAPARSPAPDLDDPFAGIEGDFDLNSTGLFTSLDDVDPGKLEEMNADELFDYIPEEIKPTRLPGTVERYPTLLMVVLVLLVLLNVGTIALLVYKMT
jgi:hypothetical protein